MSSPENERTYNTIFMGPLTHRETRVDELLNAKRSAKWSEEAENEYLENVKARATEKVRALLLQAKRKSDEIIREAEQKAQQITQEAENQANTILVDVNQQKAEAERRFNNAYDDALAQARSEMHQELLQSQKALGESTAVVLLSIHEQLGNLYNVWKEDLKQLTLEAIQVGTGWIASTEKEKIIRQLLDESVQRLLEKRDYIVRVNPADAELVMQVLENSKDKSWSMESSKDLEPGSLEVENNHVFVKNSSYERQKFVQDILDNLAIPKTADDDVIIQNVTNAITHEMKTNPVLAKSYEENTQQVEQQAPQNTVPQHSPTPQEQVNEERATLFAEPFTSQEQPQEQKEISIPNIEEFMPEIQNQNDLSALPDDLDFGEDSPELKNFIQDMANTASNQYDTKDTKPEIEQALPNVEDLQMPQTKVIDELPDFEDLINEENQELSAHSEAEDMVEDFLEDPNKKNKLPNHVADDLLAEMGFSDNK